MTLRLGDINADARYDAWVRVIERIYREQVQHAWNYYLFRLISAVFRTNERLSAEAGFFFKWMVDNYVDAALMLIRRELDQQAGTENLRNLLFDIIEHPTVVCRTRYQLKLSGNGSSGSWLAERVFDRFKLVQVAENRDADYIDPEMVKSDLNQIAARAEQLREYAERTRAHRTPERGIKTTEMTFQTLHDTMSDIRSVIGKYYSLLTSRSIAQWEPIPQYDTLEAFQKAWLVDRSTVERILKE